MNICDLIIPEEFSTIFVEFAEKIVSTIPHCVETAMNVMKNVPSLPLLH